MSEANIISVSWGDHLVFGEGDGRLDTPTSLRRRMRRWRDDLGTDTIHWRITRKYINGRYYVARNHPRTIAQRVESIKWNPLKMVPDLAHELGLESYLYVSIFDEGHALAPKGVREVSYHNAMHGQHIAWQSDFSRAHPEYAVMDRAGRDRQWGVLCLGFPEVRAHFCKRFERLINDSDFDGLFICTRTQSRPADYADQFGFNEPIRQEFLNRHGRDICKEDFDLNRWRDLQGEYLTLFLKDLRSILEPKGLKLAIGTARGGILGPPMGNVTLEWRSWAKNRVVDELIINQDSCHCPSMWHRLWPMHRGYGYIQNYDDGLNMRSILEDLDEIYAPYFSSGGPLRLFVARQWDDRSASEESKLLDHDAVHGLVFSSFRFDNPEAVKRGNWVA